jgi:hypothetical protein
MSYNIVKSIRNNEFSDPGGCVSNSIRDEYGIEILDTDPNREYIVYFCGDDSKTNFEKHLKTLPEGWYYRNHDVKYTLNSFGYRTKPFDTINWEESIVIFGCSTVFGIGVTDEHTIPYFLEQISGRPVVNMGIPGSSNQLITHNNVILSDSKYPIPKVVINSWTGLTRYVLYEKEFVKCMGSWSKDIDNNYKPSTFETSHNLIPFNLMNIKTSRNIWRNKTIYRDYCAWPSIEDIIRTIDSDIKLMNLHDNLKWDEMKDANTGIHYARDINHLGSVFNLRTAEILFESIKNEL